MNSSKADRWKLKSKSYLSCRLVGEMVIFEYRLSGQQSSVYDVTSTLTLLA